MWRERRATHAASRILVSGRACALTKAGCPGVVGNTVNTKEIGFPILRYPDAVTQGNTKSFGEIPFGHGPFIARDGDDDRQRAVNRTCVDGREAVSRCCSHNKGRSDRAKRSWVFQTRRPALLMVRWCRLPAGSRRNCREENNRGNLGAPWPSERRADNMTGHQDPMRRLRGR